MDRGRVALVTGVRRAGKTTVLHQVAQELIDGGQEPDRVLMAMMDHPVLSGEGMLGEVLDVFRAEFGHVKDTRVHILLDEVHKAPNWGPWVKAIHDVHRLPVAVSGSSAVEVMAGSMSSLTGRYDPIRVRPLTLKEFMAFRGLEVDPSDEHMMPAVTDDYLRTGGFPEAVLTGEASVRGSYLVNLFEDVLLRDVVDTYPVRDIQVLKDTASLLFATTGTPVSFNAISRTLGCSVDTAKDYVSHMVDCHLVTAVPYYSRSAKVRARNPPKYYPVDTGMLDAVRGGASRGALAETAFLHHLTAGPMGVGRDVFFWKKVKEVDFVLPGKKREVYEVKYRDHVASEDLQGISRFIESEGKAKVAVVTRSVGGDLDLDGSKVELIPLWRMLLGTG
jgi:predicted AAA+ superfamily ATPase